MTTSPEPDDLPLSIEPVEGWRGWRLARQHGILVLLSLTRTEGWPARRAMRATCPDHPWDGPTMRCTCGLYAASSPTTLARIGALSCGPAVVGEVAMWGRIVEHTAGMRAQFAYPQRMRLVCAPCISAGRGAVEPVVVVELDEELVPVCRPHRADLSGQARPAAEVERELLATYAVELLPSVPMKESLGAAVLHGRSPATKKATGTFPSWRHLFAAYVVIRLVMGFAMAGSLTEDASVGSTPAVRSVPVVASSPRAAVAVSDAPTVRVAPIQDEIRWRHAPTLGRTREGPFPARRA